MSAPSLPIAVPSLEPVQEHNPTSPSQQVFSFSTKSLNSLKQEENEDKPGGLKVVADDEMPMLEPAEIHAAPGIFEEQVSGQPNSTHSLPSLHGKFPLLSAAIVLPIFLKIQFLSPNFCSW